jgi:hypothetical protein
MTTTAPTALSPTVDVLAHHDAMLDVFASIAQDCALAGVQPTGLALSNYAPGFFHMSVQLPDVEQVDVIADEWGCRPDDGLSTYYMRHGSLDVDGRTVTLNAWSTRPTIGFPAGYRPVAVSA